jgi:serine/threonine-protein kinase RsbW
VLPAEPGALARVREFLRARSRDAGLADSVADDIVLASSEACTNAVLHSGGPAFQVTWRLEDHAVEVRVRDQGRFTWTPSWYPGSTGGKGIPLMTALVDEVTVRRGTPSRPGTEVRLVKDLAGD